LELQAHRNTDRLPLIYSTLRDEGFSAPPIVASEAANGAQPDLIPRRLDIDPILINLEGARGDAFDNAALLRLFSYLAVSYVRGRSPGFFVRVFAGNRDHGGLLLG
jgi:hypothetical protein